MQFFANQNSLRRVVRFDGNVWECGFRMFLLGRNLLLLMMMMMGRRILLLLLYPLPFPIHLHLHLHLQLHLLMSVPQVHQLLYQNTGKHSLFSISKKRISFPPRLSSPRKTPSTNNNKKEKEEKLLLLLPPPLFVSSPKSSIAIYLAREQESKEVRVLFRGKVW